MKSSRRVLVCLLHLAAVGCSTPPVAKVFSERPQAIHEMSSAVGPQEPKDGPVRQAGYRNSAHEPQGAAPQPPPSVPFASAAELSVDELVQQVLARNPSLAQMTAAWQAASSRYPQVTALEDPMVAGIIGPASIGSNKVDFAYRLEASQKLPYPGKLGLRGQAAMSEAAAAGDDVEDMRLQLAESARSAFYDYFLVHRALAVNEESLQLLRDLRKTAEDRFRAAQAPQQDLLQADVEIGRQRERGLALERMRKVAIARINTLMHAPANGPLPPPPKELMLKDELPNAETLRARALAQRPDLQALSNRLAADEATLALAQREHYPDFELMAAYDAFWQPEERDLRAMVGLRMNLPIQKDRRQGAVAESMARIAQRRAELDSRVDQIGLQVQEAYEQASESEKAVRLYEETILPAARENIRAAQIAYATGKIPFLSLIEAQRSAVMLKDRFYEIQADYFRRRATLERVTGSLLTPSAPSPAPN